jgi:hypothetical protein
MLERVVHIAKNHEEARDWDIRQALKMTPEERQEVARVLKERAYGADAVDVREWHRAKSNPDHK